MHDPAVLLVRSVPAVVTLVTPSVHVHTEAISAGELGVIARGQGHQHIPGLRRAPVTWRSHMIHRTLGLVIRDSYLLLSKCWLPEDSLILSSLQSPRDTLLNTCMSGVRSLMMNSAHLSFDIFQSLSAASQPSFHPEGP